MPRITLSSGATGSDIVLSANTMFAIETGTVELSTDAGATWVEFSSSQKVVIANGRTVRPRNARTGSAVFSHMSI